MCGPAKLGNDDDALDDAEDGDGGDYGFVVFTIVFHFLGIRLRLSGLKHWLEEIGVER